MAEVEITKTLLPKEKQIENVCRALCKVHGEDPDKMVSIPSRLMKTKSFAGPQWQKHKREAERFVAAYEAMNG